MPGWWILAILFFLLAIAALIASAFIAQKPRRRCWSITAGLLSFGVLCTLVSSYDRVDTRNVGIIPEFGRPVGVHGAGILWHAPWRKVSELSEAIQLQAFESNSYDDASQARGANGNPAAINVRLANNSNAYVDENLNWRLRVVRPRSCSRITAGPTCSRRSRSSWWTAKPRSRCRRCSRRSTPRSCWRPRRMHRPRRRR